MERSSSSLAVKECEVGCHEIVHYLAGGYWWLSAFFEEMIRFFVGWLNSAAVKYGGRQVYILFFFDKILHYWYYFRRQIDGEPVEWVFELCFNRLKLPYSFFDTTETPKLRRCGTWHVMDSILLEIVLWGRIFSRGLKKEWMNFCMTTIGKWTRVTQVSLNIVYSLQNEFPLKKRPFLNGCRHRIEENSGWIGSVGFHRKFCI